MPLFKKAAQRLFAARAARFVKMQRCVAAAVTLLVAYV